MADVGAPDTIEREPQIEDTTEEPELTFPEVRTLDESAQIQMRSASKREMDLRIMPWGQVVYHDNGAEAFVQGAFREVDATKVRLLPPKPEDGKHLHMPIGRGMALEERADAAYLTVKVARTQAGDELLALAEDGVITGASVGFIEKPGGSSTKTVGGRRVRVHERVDLDHVAITWRPAYQGTGVVAMRSSAEGAGQMAESQEPVIPASEPAVPAIVPTIDTSAIQKAFDGFADRMEERVAKIEERNRQDIVIPAPESPKPKAQKGEWLKVALELKTGGQVSQRMLQERALADLITTDNPGVVPEAFSAELLGIIDAGRPFLGSTRRVPTPSSGMTLNMPVLTTRPTAGVQVNEKDDITSTATSITSSGFDAVTIAGGGDISLQLLKRSEPSYLSLYMELLAEAISENAEAEAIAALLAAGVTPGTGAINPEALTIGEAWGNAQAVKQRADTIWMSSEGVAAFIDAKSDGSNLPLYANLAADITVGGGVGQGRISGLRPVYVPALDGTGTDVIVGPSRGFAWAEDGAFELQVDVPSKAGRDVALVVIDWFAPLYPDAFTTYALS